MAENNNMELLTLNDLDILDQTNIGADLCENEPSVQNEINEADVPIEVIEIPDDDETEVNQDNDMDLDEDPSVETDRYGNRYDDSSDPVQDAGQDADTDADMDAEHEAETDVGQLRYVFDTVRGARYLVQGTSDGRIEMFTLDQEGNHTNPILVEDNDEPKSANEIGEPGSDKKNGEPRMAGVRAESKSNTGTSAIAGTSAGTNNNNDNKEPATRNESENALNTLATFRDRLDLLNTTIRGKLDRWGESYDDQDPPSLAEITDQEFNEMERRIDENHLGDFRDLSTSSSGEDEIESPENGDAASSVTISNESTRTTGTGAAQDRGRSVEAPREANSGEAHHSERDLANLSAWENRSAAQKSYLAQRHYQEVLARGRLNRKLTLQCMKYPGMVVVIKRLPKQIREMAYLYPGSKNPNTVRDPNDDPDHQNE